MGRKIDLFATFLVFVAMAVVLGAVFYFAYHGIVDRAGME